MFTDSSFRESLSETWPVRPIGPMKLSLPSALDKVIPPVAFLLAVLAVWELAVRLFDIPPILLPGPTRVVGALYEGWPRLVSATLQTLGASSTGFASSLILGTVIAMLFSQSRLVRSCCFPYAIFLQTVPIVAIAPVIIAWLGQGFWAVVVIATIISLFPIITNVTEGMTAIPAAEQELFALYGATRWQTLWKLQLPHALPQLITGAKIAAGSSVLGAIVGEMFAGVAQDRPGLGYLIFAASDQYNMAFVFAAIATTTLLGVFMFSLVETVGERYLLYWRDRKIHD